MNKVIYLDNASKSIPYPEVIEIYNTVTSDFFANPSSIHILGRQASRELDKCKEEILNLLKMNNHQVIFVNSATEANNLAIKGYALKNKNRGKHIICSSYEHPSVLEAFRQLESEFGFEVTYLDPNNSGIISKEMVQKELRKDTILVSVMAVNNEIGAVNPIEDIATLLKEYPKIAFHVDAAQAIGKLEKEINYRDVDLLTISSHKIHGLIGMAALIKKKNINLLALFSGGGQEDGLRSGTNDLASAMAFAKALKMSISLEKEHYNHVKELADILLEYLNHNLDKYELNLPEKINPYIINFSTKEKKSSVVVEALSRNNIMVSSTSACHSSKEKGSYVVKSLGKSDQIANNTIRVSFSYLNNKEEVETLTASLDKIIGEIR